MCEAGDRRERAKTRATQILSQNPKTKRAICKRAKKTMTKFFTPQEMAEFEELHRNGKAAEKKAADAA